MPPMTKPPFTHESALAKVEAADDGWNGRGPHSRVKKNLWCVADDQIGVSFEYQWCDQSGQWYRSSGNEFWEFDADGRRRQRIVRIYDVPIKEAERN